MSKKSKSKGTWIALGVILILAVIGVVLYFTGIWFNIWYAFQEPQLCSDTPYDTDCYCLKGYAKVGFLPPWECEKLPETPSDINFPISQWEDAIAYSNYLMGGFKCTGTYQYDSPLYGTIPKVCDKYGYVKKGYGNFYKGNAVIMECLEITEFDDSGKPISGRIVFTTEFDPNDGHVYEISCRSDLIDCPENLFENNWKENPQPTCGDGCCHSGETHENCPNDC